jgi:tetratricopeptide (TPR) repeat protein
VEDQNPSTADDEDFLSLNFEELRYNAKKLRRNGQYSAALDLFKKALALRSDDPETLIDIAVTETYLEGCSYEVSIKKLEELIKEHMAREKASQTAEGVIAKAFYNLACIKEISREQGGPYTVEEVSDNLECAFKSNPIYVIKALEDHDLRHLRLHPKFKKLIEKYRRDER